MLALLAFLIVLGPLIFVHELGHFVVAKAVGIQVLRFSLGFGRPLIKWVRGETEYWISWIPLGGYVKMAGLDDEGPQGELEGGKSAVPIDPARTFDSKPLWARMAVILAGVTMNLLFAIVIYAGLFMTAGEPRMAITPLDTVAVSGLPTGAEALGTVRRGDVITRINDDTVRTWNEVQDRILQGPDTVRISLAGRAEPLVVRFSPGDKGARELALRAMRPLIPASIGLVSVGQPASRAGLELGDVIIRAGGDTIRGWDEMVQKVRASGGKPLQLDVLRGDSVFQVTVTPEVQTQKDSSGREITFGMIGASPDPRGPIVRVRLGVGTAIVEAVRETGFQVATTVVMVKRLVTGKVSASEVGGPILIAQVSGQMLRLGFSWLVGFIAFVSISLAVLNLLPIPVLDGGHAMFLIAEGIRRKPLSPQLRLRLTQVGMLLVLAIMVLAISNDVIRNLR
ncbi:MAG: RIP metalloprotease RseP [Gemmatimonadales bacterium]